MHSRKRVRLSTLRKSWAPAPQSTWHPPQTPPPTSRRLLLASFSLPAHRLLCNTTPAHHPGFECSTASVPANRVGGKQALGWWQINCRVRKRRESASEAACIITRRWLSIHCTLAHLPDHRQCPLGQPTVRAPFEDQPCPRGTKRNNRQIKVGQSARSLRVPQLSKRAC